MPDDTRSFDFATTPLARLATFAPSIAYPIADALGAMRNRIVRRWPAVAELRSLFPDRDDYPGLAARIGALNERNRVLVRCIVRCGIEPVSPLVSISPELAILEGPNILATFHVGAMQALGPGLEQLSRPVIGFRLGRLYDTGPNLTMESVEGSTESRAASLVRAANHLRAGGFVSLAIDYVTDDFIETRCLGQTLRLAPGAFALARWSGAPIRPVVARWSSSMIHIDVGQSIATPDDAASWLERYLSDSPSELTLGLLRNLLGVS